MNQLVLIAALALIPAIPLVQVSTSQLAKAKSYWLLGLLTVGITWLAWSELWLALIGFCFLCRWRSHEQMASLFQWGAIGASWWLLLQVPAWGWEWVRWGWLALGVWQVVLMVERRWQVRQRVSGTFGSVSLTGMYLALTLPLAPWWLWPVFLLGLGMTSSPIALVGAAAGVAWLWPWLTGWLLLAGFVFLGLWLAAPMVAGVRIFEWLPRGDTFDSEWARLYAWRITLHEFARDPKQWLCGHGPGSTAKMLRQWTSRIAVELSHEVTNETLQMTFEYGLLGFLAVCAFVARVGPHLVLGEAWSAAWMAFAVMTFGHWAGRHPVLGPCFLAISARIVLG